VYVAVPNKEGTNSVKCGVVVGKKIARKAVTRHQVRRKVYDVLGRLLPALQGLHVAILTKPGAATCGMNELLDDIAALTEYIRNTSDCVSLKNKA
jgi:ribonuclease P protein component